MSDISFGTAFVAGVLTFLSPCVLPLVPIFLSNLIGLPILSIGKKQIKQRGLLVLSTLFFVFGFSTVFILLGLTATGIGIFLNNYRLLLSQTSGVIVVLLGLKYLGVIQIPLLEREYRISKNNRFKYSFSTSFLFGVFFSLGWTPCVGPVLGTVLTYTASNTSNSLTGLFLLVSYSLGLSIPFLLVAVFLEPATVFLGKIKKHIRKIEIITGGLILVAGLLLVTDGLSYFSFPDKTVVKTTSQKQKKPKLIEYFSPNCNICNAMIPILASLEEDCRSYGVSIEKKNIDDQINHKEAKKLGIRGIPTFIFFDSNGLEFARLVGYQKINVLKGTLEALGGESCDTFKAIDIIQNHKQECSESCQIK